MSASKSFKAVPLLPTLGFCFSLLNTCFSTSTPASQLSPTSYKENAEVGSKFFLLHVTMTKTKKLNRKLIGSCTTVLKECELLCKIYKIQCMLCKIYTLSSCMYIVHCTVGWSVEIFFDRTEQGN